MFLYEKFNKKNKLIGLFSLLVLLLFIVYTSCKKTSYNANPTGNLLPDAQLKSDVILTKDSAILQSLFKSDAWKTLPITVLNNIKDLENPHYESFKTVPFKIILFDISGNDPNIVYRSLLVYVYGNSFVPVIAQSIRYQSIYTKVSISDLISNDYMNLLVNKQGKMGHFKLLSEIPFNFKTSPSINTQLNNDLKSRPLTPPSCPSSNTTWSGCMNCAVDECSHDWACAFGCAAEWQGCLAVFAGSCLFHADKDRNKQK